MRKQIIAYTTPNGEEKFIGDFGNSTQNEFDEALAVIPELIAMSRNGNVEAGNTAKALLWHIANEAFNTRAIKAFETHYIFGNEEEGETE